jgi:sulfite reductase beta subunit-like hemoprotein
MTSWKNTLSERIPTDLAEEIDAFASQIKLKKQGKVDDKLFAETRLRRGAYGQRYDNGQRHDGIETRELHFPTNATKGPDTLWDAPGMQRIKIPFGGLSTEQMEALADLAEEYSDAICHITTRQDVQLHYVHIDDTPDLMRRLAAVGITTREACGNSVRNVTACPVAGVCHDESFDITPYARAMAYFLLGHPDTQDFGRKFKVAFSGCKDKACGLTNIHDLGLVIEERKTLPHDDRWIGYLDEVRAWEETPVRKPAELTAVSNDEEFNVWRDSNTYGQRQQGYSVATIRLPLGDITSWQMRQLADVARKYCGDNIRTTVEQNIVLRWVANGDLPALYDELKHLGLAQPGAGTIFDVVSCPGTDTCKLGISSSRGLAGELHERLATRYQQFDSAIQGLHIKISGCFNSCGQHHLADLGFYGVSRKMNGATVPHFRVVLGGQWEQNGGSYGMTIGAVPSKRVPDFIDRITGKYLEERHGNETFQAFVQRIGKRELKKVVDELASVPPYALDPTYYSDWRDPREYSISDIGVGECAGEVVSRIDFDLNNAERLYFEAQLAHEEGALRKADETAFSAMIAAAGGLVRLQNPSIPDDPEQVVPEFRKRYYDTRLFFDKYAGGKFAEYLFNHHEQRNSDLTADRVRLLLEETQLFIEATHACNARLMEQADNERKSTGDKTSARDKTANAANA